MVARINTSKSISKALNYNEQKVIQGKAECILASGFIKDLESLLFNDKLRQFERLNSLNEKVSVNTLHVSLNFSPSEKFCTETLKEIAQSYMGKIGFNKQPYLVYRHDDSGHPHIHIVSTNIQKDGSRISLHNLGRNQSEKARKEIETEFNLVKAQGKELNAQLNLKAINAKKINYGKTETKRAISNVLMTVISQYKFTSLTSLNAVLKLYNVAADRGEKDSRTFLNNGLFYRILDESGNKTGVPIKASSIYLKPTLAFLQLKFEENKLLKKPHERRIQTAIDWVINKKNLNTSIFKAELEKENIDTIFWKNKENLIYGITYVDHRTKCVFNGSELGKKYSAKAIIQSCNPKIESEPIVNALSDQKVIRIESNERISSQLEKYESKKPLYLSQQTPNGDYIPFQLKKSRKKKKRKRVTI